MLPACATSPVSKRLAAAPDPIVEQRTVIKTLCPPELLGSLPTKPAVPAAARIEANDAGLGWVADLARWGDGLFARLADAARPCAR